MIFMIKVKYLVESKYTQKAKTKKQIRMLKSDFYA